MLKNYLKIAFRNLGKNKIDSAISIGGLAVGIACCLLLVAYVQFEWSFDEFHEKKERIYLVYNWKESPNEEKDFKSSFTTYQLAPVLEATNPAVEEAVRVRGVGAFVKIDGNFIAQRNIMRAEPNFLKIFTFPLIAGNPETALDEPGSILLTREKAEQIFGTWQVIGKTVALRRRKEVSFTVTGILKNIPANSSFNFEYLLPYDNHLIEVRQERRQNWYLAGTETYLLLSENVNPTRVEKNLERNLKDAVPADFLELTSLHLLPLNDVYFSPELNRKFRQSANPLYGWILAGIALVVLAIAAINFMSLTLSRAARRANEISVRKVVGAGRSALTWQFMGEAFLVCSFAFLLAAVLAELSMPFFSALVNKPVSLGLLNNPVVWTVLVGLLLLTTLITGGYPAWVLARQKAVSGFTSRTTSSKIPAAVKGMIVAQFALAITFLCSAFIMFSQMNYIAKKDLGFNPKNLVDIRLNLTNPERGTKMYDVFSRATTQIPGIKSVTPIYDRFGSTSFTTILVTDSLQTHIKIMLVGNNFVETMGISVISGRTYTEERTSDYITSAFLNQEAAELFGWENPLGKVIDQTTHETDIDGKKIIGVIKNYHIRPLFYSIEPVLFMHRSQSPFPGTSYMRVRIAEGMVGKTLDKLEQLWNEMYPASLFHYEFITDMIAKQYEKQQRWKSIISLATVITILLACFGLFGLTVLSAQRRTKEIGIRKVMGATVTNIVSLLSKDFLELVLIGFLIAVPVAWYFMNRWLQDFAYRIDLDVGVFLLAGALALLIALATVSWQSVRAALANPVDSLRSE